LQTVSQRDKYKVLKVKGPVPGWSIPNICNKIIVQF